MGRSYDILRRTVGYQVLLLGALRATGSECQEAEGDLVVCIRRHLLVVGSCHCDIWVGMPFDQLSGAIGGYFLNPQRRTIEHR